ncbi:MAG: DUF4392 domain-containing protein [Chloroflexi bacterium]|nr:DUF4392 domain-containing protein [Chloroflexota bacterium]
MTHASIEDIVLNHDTRGISALRGHLPANFVEEAAQQVLDRPGKALIATGFYIVYADAPETDGPPGAVAIGEALKKLGYEVAYVTDKWSKLVVETVAGDTEVIEFPVATHFESSQFANAITAAHSPSVLISIERAGLVGDGTFRNWKGEDISKFNAKIDHLFDQHPHSVGIGDGGNEIGMGNLRHVIPGTPKLPDNPCVTTTTKLVIASTSNWGGYGLVAQLGLMTGRDLLPSVEQGYEWVRQTVAAGAVEGLSGARKDWVDGRDPEADSVCLRDLHDFVKSASA